MNFTANPKQQWQFIISAISYAESDDELGHIAAGPIEHLLGLNGEKYIDCVEALAQSNPKFARALTGVWQYKMTDEVWLRVKELQSKVAESIGQSDKQNEET